MSEGVDTSYTLIQRALNLNDQSAWEDLHRHYLTFVYYVLNTMGMPSVDNEDICQKVFINLTKNLSRFDKSKGGFRGWLSRVIKNEALNHLRKKSRDLQRQGKAYELFDMERQLEGSGATALMEREWESYVRSVAIDCVKKAHTGKALMVFEMDLDDASNDEIVSKTGLTIASVYTLRMRVRKSLLNELDSIRSHLEP